MSRTEATSRFRRLQGTGRRGRVRVERVQLHIEGDTTLFEPSQLRSHPCIVIERVEACRIKPIGRHEIPPAACRGNNQTVATSRVAVQIEYHASWQGAQIEFCSVATIPFNMRKLIKDLSGIRLDDNAHQKRARQIRKSTDDLILSLTQPQRHPA